MDQPNSSQPGDEETVTRTKIVKGPKGLKRLLKTLDGLPTKPPSIYLDASASTQDQLLNIQLLVLPKNRVYVVDMNSLGSNAFSAVGEEGDFHSLRLVLESKDIPKVGFDIRDMSKLLQRQFNLSFGGMYDLQSMELASREEGRSKKFLEGIQRFIYHEIPSADMTRRVETFPALWRIYRQRLGNPGGFWLASAREESQKRATHSRQGTGHQNEMRLGPMEWWDRELREAAMDEWAETCMEEYRVGDMELNDDAEWVSTGNTSTELNPEFARMHTQLLTMKRQP